MIDFALDSHSDSTRSTSSTIALQRDLGWQLRLFPADAPRDDVEVEVDLCVSDDLAGMYYIG